MEAMHPGVVACPSTTPLRVVARMLATYRHAVIVFPEHFRFQIDCVAVRAAPSQRATLYQSDRDPRFIQARCQYAAVRCYSGDDSPSRRCCDGRSRGHMRSLREYQDRPQDGHQNGGGRGDCQDGRRPARRTGGVRLHQIAEAERCAVPTALDPAWFLSGVTANVAAAEDGVVTAGQPVPNDNHVVNESHRPFASSHGGPPGDLDLELPPANMRHPAISTASFSRWREVMSARRRRGPEISEIPDATPHAWEEHGSALSPDRK
jgi:hypothetical protein